MKGKKVFAVLGITSILICSLSGFTGGIKRRGFERLHSVRRK